MQTLVDGDNLQLAYGAQDLSPHADGAYTGDISAGMLAKLGCSYVVVGHSERRQVHGESDDLVHAKAKAAIDNGLTPIICVGEDLEVRELGGQVEHCDGQLQLALAGLGPEQVAKVVLAYEPIWAIGTGKVATSADAQEVCAALRRQVALYGRRHGRCVDPHPVRRLGQGRQRRRPAGRARRRRRAGRRGQPGRRRVRRHLPRPPRAPDDGPSEPDA